MLRTASYRVATHANVVRKVGWGIRTAAASSGKNEEKDRKSKPENQDTSLSGGAYAKRSDEQGFGAVYGGNPSLSKEEEAKIVHGNTPEYNQSEGNTSK